MPARRTIVIQPGERFGKLTVVEEREERTGQKRGYLKRTFLCLCDCGNHVAILAAHLRSGHIKSCGNCLREQHGFSGSPEYEAWCNMKDRCYCPNDRGFHTYGARGITVCDEWRNSFAAFYRDMGPRPSPDHTIERKNNDGPYSKKNCEWIHYSKQGRNKTNNHKVTFQGETLCLAEWARKLGIRASILEHRLNRKWPIEDALYWPIGRRRPIPRIPTPDRKTCSICHQEKEASEFGRTPKNLDGLLGQCKECRKEYHRGWYEKNRKHVRKYSRRKS